MSTGLDLDFIPDEAGLGTNYSELFETMLSEGSIGLLNFLSRMLFLERGHDHFIPYFYNALFINYSNIRHYLS
jgi:hypothetical protein